MSFSQHGRVLGAVGLIALASGCSSSGQSSLPVASIVAPPTAAPTATPKPVATASPTPVASPTSTAVPTATPTAGVPTPTPTATATTSSAITITYADNNIGYVALPTMPTACSAASLSQQFTASEPGVTTFTAVSASPTQVTVSPMQGNGTFVATEPTSNSNNAMTTIAVFDGQGRTANAIVKFALVCFP